ncbi:uncharacterized protein LOC124910486 [Impatiens glandulifera]|uniref:uncharacterized protein LOC124910486 n=1 Tax=Impatiens glandulifera TaxID=253017 RepID=UPI001FB0A942|nr:uncharacterized protein LOC124910486 [Impatiens glandulifera]
MRFLLECVPCCGSSTYRSTSTPPLPPLAILEHQTDDDSLNRGRKRVRRRISRSMSSVDWRPSLASIYEEDFITEEEEEKKKQVIAGSDKGTNKKKKSAISVAKFDVRSYSFDVNDFGRRSLPSMNSGFCATPFMI